ncbi:unnamed protein product, partial [Rotaria magnacalcarata]
IGNSELNAQRILSSQPSPSPELIERVGNLLRTLDNIHFNNINGTLILDDNFVIPNEYIHELFQEYQAGQTLNANQVADILLHICDREEDQDGQSIILSLDGQILKLAPRSTIIEEQQIDDD